MIQELFGTDLGAGLFIVMNLILLESLLSVDNAAVLASLVMDLPKHQRNRALRYGIIGAYIFRGLCLIFASWLIKILWLKIIGGIYLCWLAYGFFKPKKKEDKEQDSVEKESNVVFRMFKNTLGVFWTTIILVEVMDLSFSIDNIFAAVAFTPKIGLICLGVFIGILAMRFVAQGFVKIMEKYPMLESVAFIAIAILGVKLLVSGIFDYIPGNPVTPIMNHHLTDIIFSIGILFLFIIPIIFRKKNNPANTNSQTE